MKRVKALSVFLAVIMVISFSSCRKNDPANSNPSEFTADREESKMLSNLVRIDENGALYYLDYTYDYNLDQVLSANISNVYDLLSYVDGKLITNVQDILLAISSHCSSFTVSDNDEYYFCRNFDAVNNTVAALLIHTSPKDGYESVSLADVGSLGLSIGTPDDGKTDISLAALAPLLVVDGMNEKGLAVSAMVLDEDPACQDTGKPKIMTTVAMRLLLDRAADVDEAIELLSKYDMQSPNSPKDFHYMITDAKGNCKIVEYVNNEMKIIDQKYSTNFYISEEMFGKGHGQDRYDILKDRLEGSMYSLSGEEAYSLLQDVSQHGNEESGSYTIWSNMYNLTSLEVSVVVERNYDKKYTYKLGTGWL